MTSMGVYPRVCGGTVNGAKRPRLSTGLSPRVRGNRCSVPDCVGAKRSIPACAGEPSFRLRRSSTSRVYPRVCGGTAVALSRMNSKTGLSPRVRGNPCGIAADLYDEGSIPACAGEPHCRCTGHHQ